MHRRIKKLNLLSTQINEEEKLNIFLDLIFDNIENKEFYKNRYITNSRINNYNNYSKYNKETFSFTKKK